MKKFVLLTLTLVLVLSLFTGCNSKSAHNENDSDSIKIGLNYELSGDVATYGQSLTAGIELAVEEINANEKTLGKKLNLIKIDNKSDDTEAANVSSRLATRDKVVAILGAATSGNTKAASPAAMENKIPLISGSSTTDDITVDSNGNVREYIFKTCFSDSFQGIMMANFAMEDLGFKNAAILIDNTSDYSQGLTKSFKDTYKELGGNVLIEEAYQGNDTDFKAVLTNIKNSDPDFLFLPGYYEEVGLIIRQARELGLDIPILGGDGYESPKLTEIAGEDVLDNVYYSSHYSSMDDSEEVVLFNKAFEEKYGKNPDAFNAMGYDLAYFLTDAFERAKEVDSEKLKDAIADTKMFTGVTGSFSIDEYHNPVKSVTIIKMENGLPTFLKKLDPK